MVEGDDCGRRLDIIRVDLHPDFLAGKGDAAERIAADKTLDRNVGRSVSRVRAGRSLLVVVEDVRLRLRSDGKRSLVDDQLSGVDRDLLIVRRSVFAAGGNGKLNLFFGVVLIRSCVDAGRRSIGSNGEHVALTEAGNDVVFGFDRFFTGAGDGGERASGLLRTGVGNSLVLDRDDQRCSCHGEEAGLAGNIVVIRVDGAPLDLVGVVAAADLGLAAIRRNSDFTLIGRHKTVKTGLIIRQRCAVVCLCGAARGDHEFRRLDLQTAFTDVQAHAVVVIRRRAVFYRQYDLVRILVGVFLGDANVSKACGRVVMHQAVFLYDRSPDIVQVLGRVSLVADDHVIRDTLASVGEAGLLHSTVVDVAGPSVGLHTDGHVDLGNFQSAADVTDAVVVGIGVSADHSVFRGDGRHTGVKASLGISRVRIGVRVLQRRQGVTIQQAVHRDLIRQILGQSKHLAIVLLAGALHGDGGSLLEEQGEFQAVRGRSDLFGDLVGIPCLSSAVGRTLDRLVQLPAGDGVSAEYKGLADLQDL